MYLSVVHAAPGRPVCNEAWSEKHGQAVLTHRNPVPGGDLTRLAVLNSINVCINPDCLREVEREKQNVKKGKELHNVQETREEGRV